MNDTSQSSGTLGALGVLILAAGKGTRMYSDKPKVLQPLLEEPVIYYPLKAAHDAGLSNVAVLVGYQGEVVESYIREEWPNVDIMWQHEQLGTGHAVRAAAEWWEKFDHLLVLSGDVPLVRPETLTDLVEKHNASDMQCSMMSFMAENPHGYGRIVRLADGGVRITEHKDATSEELLIREINAGVYIFNTHALSKVIGKLKQNNEQREYYLTDTIPLIGDSEGAVNVVICDDSAELLGINTPMDLALASHKLNERIVSRHMQQGVKCMDPATTWIGPKVSLEQDVFIEPGVRIWGDSKIGDRTRIGAYSALRNTEIGDDSVVLGPSVIEDSSIGCSSEIGPFAFIRNHAEIKDHVRVGRFVEIKHSTIEDGAKTPHLSYIGDAVVGSGTNVGAGTITCNYDGRSKHRTVIGSGSFVGSSTMLVAPVTLGDHVTTAAGSVITKDVPDGALAVGRARQTNIEGWHDRKKTPDGVSPKSEGK